MIFRLLFQIELILLLLEKGNSFKIFAKQERSIKKTYMKNDYDSIDKNKKFEKIFNRLNYNHKNKNNNKEDEEDFEKINKKQNNEYEYDEEEENYYQDGEDAEDFIKKNRNTIEIIFKPTGFIKSLGDDEMTFDEFKKKNKRIMNENMREEQSKRKEVLKSENFEIIKNYDFTFENIGGYDETFLSSNIILALSYRAFVVYIK
jgi:hypothetical protein